MNRKPPSRFEPSSPLLRVVFAAFALAATVATGDFIDALAHGKGTTARLIVQTPPVVIAHR